MVDKIVIRTEQSGGVLNPWFYEIRLGLKPAPLGSSSSHHVTSAAVVVGPIGSVGTPLADSNSVLQMATLFGQMMMALPVAFRSEFLKEVFHQQADEAKREDSAGTVHWPQLDRGLAQVRESLV